MRWHRTGLGEPTGGYRTSGGVYRPPDERGAEQARARTSEGRLTTVEPRPRGRSTAIADGLAFMARWSLRLALIGLGCALLWWLIAKLWVIVMPVLLGLLITTVLYPPARWLRRRGAPPALAAAAVLLGALLLLAAVVYFLATSITGGVSEIATSAVAGIQSIQNWISGPPLNIGATQFDALLQQVTQRLQSSVTTIASGVLTGVGTLASLVVTGLLAVVLAFLFVKDGDRFLPWLRGVVGPRAGGHLSVVLSQIWGTLGGFIRGQVLVSLCDGVFIGAGLLIVGVPLALPLAVLTFIGGFVPIVGALFAGALSVLVALVTNGFTSALIVLGIVLLVQQVEGNVLQPILQGKSLNLHAAVVLLAVAAGGTLYGIAGAFLAVPVAAAGATVLRYLFEQVDRTSEDDDTDAPADPEAAQAAGVPPAGEQADAGRVDGAAVNGPAVVDVPSDLRGAVPEPRPDAPNPEQLEIADDPSAAPPISEERRLPRG